MMEKSFNEKCYELLKKVPKGKVTTYKAIAQKLNSKAYRQVGKAMNKNPCSFVKGGNVPCHRVVGSNGNLVGFAHGLKKKTEMLRNEGIEVKNGKIDLKKYRFKF
jgi:methylated-DNA-[protein]-cysteine S-methyltransferase